MSMTTEQIKKLKDEADLVECTHDYTAKLLREAADTIEQLAAKVRAENNVSQPCEDAISRQAVLNLCDSKDPDYKVIHLKEDVECLPSVNPQAICEEREKGECPYYAG